MIFIETSLFSRALAEHLSDEEFRGLQGYLMERPDAGVIIQRSGGIRKLRWAAGGKGKSGGVRVIYYWFKADDQIVLLTLYGKSEKADLSAAELKQIVKLIGELK